MIFLATKFAHGAFIIVIIIPGLIVLFRRIHRYYDTLGTALATSEVPPALEIGVPGLVLVPVIDISRLTWSSWLAPWNWVARSGLFTSRSREPTDSLEARWQTLGPGVPLIVVPSPQRSVVHAFLAYLATPEVAAHQNILVLIGEIEPRKLRHRLLLNQRGAILATALRRRTNALVATVPFRLE